MGRKEEAYEYIKEAILTNRLKPGMPVREMDIVEQLKMSRTPIREAMRDLEAEGLVSSFSSRGTFVASITPYDVEEISELRTLLEVWALERSFNRITDEELTYLQEELEQAKKTGDWERNHRADRLFHKLIVEKSGSRRVIQFINNLNTQIERIRRVSARHSGRSQLSYAEHMEIIRCIRSGDLEASCAALKKHLQSVGASAIEAARGMDIEFHIDK